MVRDMIRTIDAALPAAQSLALRSLLHPPLTHLTLRALGDPGTSFGPLLQHSASPTVVNGGSSVNGNPGQVTLEIGLLKFAEVGQPGTLGEVEQGEWDDAEAFLGVRWHEPFE